MHTASLSLVLKAAGFDSADIQVRQEPEGVNLFLHLKKGKDFLPDPNHQN